MSHDMPSIGTEIRRGKYRGPSYEIFVFVEGKKTSYSMAVDINNALGIAHSMAQSERLKVMNLSYQRVVHLPTVSIFKRSITDSNQR